MLTFSHAASRGEIGHTVLPTDLVELIVMQALNRFYHARCHRCAYPVLVERHDAWIEAGQRVSYEIREGILFHDRSCRVGHVTDKPPRADDLVLDGTRGVACANAVPPACIRLGPLAFDNRTPQLYQTIPYGVLDGRFVCGVCRCELRKLGRILRAWRRLRGVE